MGRPYSTNSYSVLLLGMESNSLDKSKNNSCIRFIACTASTNQGIFRICEFLALYHRTDVFCCKERSLQKKKYSNSKVREKYSSRFYSAMITATRKVLSSPFLSVVTVCVCVWELVVWHTLVTADWSQQTGVGPVGPPEPLTNPFWQLPLTLPKSHYLISYIEILGNKMKIRECSTRDIISVIILKSRLTLQVILPARASLMTPSLIDDSACL